MPQQCTQPELPLGTEEWRPLPNHPRYEISSSGALRGPGSRWKLMPTKSLKLDTDKRTGYARVILYVSGQRKRYFAHRLVAGAFLGPPPSPIHEVNHLDGNHMNNRVSNLEWTTPSGNTQHALANGLLSRNRGRFHSSQHQKL